MAKISLIVEVDAAKGTAEIKRFAQESETATKKVGEGAKEGAKGLDTMDASAKKTAKSLSDLLTPANLAAAAIGTALVASLKSALTEASQFADEIHRLQLLTGSSVRNLASLVDVANDVGVEFGAVQMALLRLANASADSDGALSQFNLTAKDGVGRLAQLAEKLSGVTDANQKAAIVSELFGARVAAGLLPLMDRLKHGMVDLGAETNDFANILGDDGVTALRNFGIAQGQVGDALLALKIVVAKDLLPVMGPLVAMTEQMVKWFYAVPAPVRAAVEVLGLAAAAITAVNLALRLFGITTLAMTGPAGWIALAIAGVAVLVTSLEGLGTKLTSLWTDFKNRGMTPVPAPSAGAATGASGTPPPVILPKEVIEANKAIKQQIETLQAQKIELEQGAVAALKYSLAHGEMAKASPALKAQLVTLTQAINSLTIAQEMAAQTQATAVDELNELKKKEKELQQTTNDANAVIREQNLLFVDAGRFADDLREEVDGVIARTKELLQWEQERIDLQVRLKSLAPADAERERSKALQEAITQLRRYKDESLSAYGAEAQVIKDVDRELLKLSADQADLLANTKGWGSAFKDVFDGALGILSLFGVKIGRVFLMLQNLPQALGGLQKMFAGINSLASLAGIAAGATIPGTAAAAVADLGKAAGLSAENLTGLSGVVNLVERALMLFGNGLLGIFNFFGQIVQGITSGGGIINTLTAAFGGLLKAGGLLSGVFSSLSSIGTVISSTLQGAGSLAAVFQSVFNAVGLTSGGFAAGPAVAGGTVGLVGGAGQFAQFAADWLPVAGALYSLATTIQSFFNGPLAVSLGRTIGGAIGAVIGTMLGGPPGGFIGFSIGSFIGGFIGGLFAPTPKASLSATILPFNRNAMGSSTGMPGNTGTQVGRVLVNVGGNIMKNSKEDDLQLALAALLNKLLQDVVTATVGMLKILPPSIATQLDAALTQLETTGLTIIDKTWKGGKAGKRFSQHVQGLMGEALQDLVKALNFGDVDLKALGFDPKDPKGKKGGEIARGFEVLMTALAGLSAIVQAVGPAVNLAGVSLADFTKGALDLFKSFAQKGEPLIDTIKRVMQAFGEIIVLRDQVRASIVGLTKDLTEAVSIIKAQMATAETRMVALADALTVAIQSGAKPEDVLATAQAATKAVLDTLKMEIDAVTVLHNAVKDLNTSIAGSVDLMISLTQKIDALRGVPVDPEMMQASIETITRLFDEITDVTLRISLFGSELVLLSESTGGILANLPLVTAAFDTIMAQIQQMANPSDAVAALKGLAGAIDAGLQAGIAGINRQTQARITALNVERDAITQAFAARRAALEQERSLISHVEASRTTALEAERTLITENFNVQKQALQDQLAIARQWESVGASARGQLVSLFNLSAPTHPLTSLNEVRAQFGSAFAQFQTAPTAKGATQVQDLAKQLLDLAHQTPGYDLPSAAFQGLATEIQGALSAIALVAEAQPTQEQIQAQIADLETQQAASLVSIDAQIAAGNAEQSAQLASIDAQLAALDADQSAQLALIDAQIREANLAGQAQIQQLQALAASKLEAIRAQLTIEITALAAQQALAAAALQAVLGDKTFEQFIADKQAKAVDLLRSIDRTLQNYLGAIITNLFPGAGPVGTPLPAGTTGIEAFAPFLPHAQHGMDYVAQDGPVFLHRGERVLTALENSTFSPGSSGKSRGGGEVTLSVTLAPTIQITGGRSSSRMKDDLDRALVEIVNGPSLTRSALTDLAKRTR